jgi:hypothetical protein
VAVFQLIFLSRQESGKQKKSKPAPITGSRAALAPADPISKMKTGNPLEPCTPSSQPFAEFQDEWKRKEAFREKSSDCL